MVSFLRIDLFEMQKRFAFDSFIIEWEKADE